MEPSLEIEDGAGRRRVFFGDGLCLGLTDGTLQPLVNGSSSKAIAELSLSPDGLWILAPAGAGLIELNGAELTDTRPIWPGDRLRIGQSTAVVLDRGGNAPRPGAYERAVEPGTGKQLKGRVRRPTRPVFGLRDDRPGPPTLDELEYSRMLRREDRAELDLARAVSAGIDLMVLVPAIAAAVLLLGTANPYTYAVIVAMAGSYFFLCETLFGQTLGKRITGLRVLRLDGRQLGPNAIAVRTVLRLIDYAPAFYFVGAVTMSITRGRRQRLGDLAAGTVVADGRTHHARKQLRQRHGLLLTVAYPALWLAPAVTLAAAIGYLSPMGAYLQRVRDACQARARIEAALGPSATFVELDRVESVALRTEMSQPIPSSAFDLAGQIRAAQQDVSGWRDEIQSDYNAGASQSFIASQLSELRQQMRASNRELSSLGLAACRQTIVGTLARGAQPTTGIAGAIHYPKRPLVITSLPQNVGPPIAALTPDGHGGVWAAAFNGFNPEADALVDVRPGHPPAIAWMPRDRGDPAGIAVGPDGAVWFTEAPRYGMPGRLGRLAGGRLQEYLLPGEQNRPTQLISGRADSLWFLDGDNRFGRFNLVTKRFTIMTLGPATFSNQLTSLTAGPDSDVWVTRAGTTVDRISASGTIKEYRVASRLAGPSGIVSGPEGKLWLDYSPQGLASMTTAGAVTVYRLPPDLAGTQAMMVSREAVWFGVGGYAGYPPMLGRLTPTGKFQFYVLPRGWSETSAMTAASGGRIWLANNDGQIASWITSR